MNWCLSDSLLLQERTVVYVYTNNHSHTQKNMPFRHKNARTQTYRYTNSEYIIHSPLQHTQRLSNSLKRIHKHTHSLACVTRVVA